MIGGAVRRRSRTSVSRRLRCLNDVGRLRRDVVRRPARRLDRACSRLADVAGRDGRLRGGRALGGSGCRVSG
jgi:hypothetical protein